MTPKAPLAGPDRDSNCFAHSSLRFSRSDDPERLARDKPELAKAPSPCQLQAAFPLTLALSLREREHRIPHCDESRRPGLAKARRTILPLLGERAGVRGKIRSANQRAGELPMEPTTLSEGKQSSTLDADVGDLRIGVSGPGHKPV